MNTKNYPLVRARKSLRLNRYELAKEIGVSNSRYCLIESRKVYPPIKIQNKISEYFVGKGMPLLEEDLFPKRLGPQKYQCEIPKGKLVPLDYVDENLLPSHNESVEKINQNDLREQLEIVLNALREKEKQIIELRFGINCSPMSLESLGNLFNISRERIRQIESTALRNLKYRNRGGPLEIFLKGI
ncbi:MAG: sigma factor-like helix-turn-helix DNA-binding protein [Nanoarchaeota archaeon]|nr:sigma factor-like helix-turn-helix DNA-binding protein [Nanoarchaeota archaeon]